MIFNETFDYLYSLLAGGRDSGATMRLSDYQRKRVRRALLARSIRPYLLEASWINAAGIAGEENTASTLDVTKRLIVLDGAIRTSNQSTAAAAGGQNGTSTDLNNFELLFYRTGGDSRVQMQDRYIKDEQLVTAAQAAIKDFTDVGSTGPIRLGQGAPNPLTWPVPLRLMENELIQVKSRVLTGGLTAGKTTFVQFRAVSVDNKAEDDSFVTDLNDYVKTQPVQRPFYLSMFSEDARSVVFSATGALQRTIAKTREAPQHLLVLGYAALFARSTGFTALETAGTTCSPKWRLQSSNGYAFSREEVDLACYAYPGPGSFWAEFPQPFLLPKGCSLSASFSTLDAIQNALEQIDNYVIFRCVTV